MTVINSFYRNPNAQAYAIQLFSASSPVRPPPEPARSLAGGDDRTFTETAGQKALARIAEILALRDVSVGDQASVEESLGFITAAQGTEADDKLTFDATAVYNVTTVVAPTRSPPARLPLLACRPDLATTALPRAPAISVILIWARVTMR